MDCYYCRVNSCTGTKFYENSNIRIICYQCTQNIINCKKMEKRKKPHN